MTYHAQVLAISSGFGAALRYVAHAQVSPQNVSTLRISGSLQGALRDVRMLRFPNQIRISL